MKLKSLILGSATAALAATGAQAADAIIIAEPEPVEYVRVCDVYGAGYFYIPGTETCLKISGWVRHQVDVNSDVRLKRWENGVRTQGVDNVGIRRVSQGTGAQINLDARSETEYGTLRGWVQLEGFASNRGAGATAASIVSVPGAPTNTPGLALSGGATKDIDIYINRALIQLGGLYMGYADSLFSSSSNFGGSSLGNYGGFTFADTFDYHYSQNHQIGYQFNAGNGFWGAIAIEHDTDNTDKSKFKPDVLGKIAYQQAWGGVWLAAAYDNVGKGAGVRGGVQGNFGALTARLDGYYRSKAAVQYGPSISLTGPWNANETPSEGTRWGVQGTALYQFNPKLGIAAGLGYYKDLVASDGAVYVMTRGNAGSQYGTTKEFVDGHAWTAQLGLNWTPVQNFQIGADVLYRKAEAKLTDTAGNAYKGTADATSFRLRFQRNF